MKKTGLSLCLGLMASALLAAPAHRGARNANIPEGDGDVRDAIRFEQYKVSSAQRQARRDPSYITPSKSDRSADRSTANDSRTGREVPDPGELYKQQQGAQRTRQQ